jgi:hypothetical protein
MEVTRDQFRAVRPDVQGVPTVVLEFSSGLLRAGWGLALS